MKREGVAARSVFWCWIINELMVVQFDGDDPRCPECHCTCTPESTEGWFGSHTFVTKIDKPKVEAKS